jgi:phenylalanine-4-hydroxylase
LYESIPTQDRVPGHLRRFVVQQDEAAYTAIDQAVWRFVLLQLYHRLHVAAHPAYARGFAQAGMSVERIPRIADIDAGLRTFGWGAVCVDGFIPPRAFQEFQALGILPIAADMRTAQHLPYTPAPDIIHEAAGHAPILPDPEYAAFLRRIGECGMRSFASARDGALYEAIRHLSVVKEQPDASADQVADAERVLATLVAEPSQPSEAAKLARLYWWTVEYGLVGTPEDYRLYGAGLLSSLAESHFCAEPVVRKLPLTAACVGVDYDITRPQPQLFVARDFIELRTVLDEVCSGFAFRSGGLAGLQTAEASAEVATVELASGLQLTGLLQAVIAAGSGARALLFAGPSAIAERDRMLPGHGRSEYPEGMLVALGESAQSLDARSRSARQGQVRFALADGVAVEARACAAFSQPRAGLNASVLRDARVLRGDRVIAEVARLGFSCTTDSEVVAVCAGARDALYWPKAEYPDRKVPAPAVESAQQRALRGLYEQAAAAPAASEVALLHAAVQREHPEEWLLRWGLLERLIELGVDAPRRQQIAAELWRLEHHFHGRNPIAMGLRYLGCGDAAPKGP